MIYVYLSFALIGDVHFLCIISIRTNAVQQFPP